MARNIGTLAGLLLAGLGGTSRALALVWRELVAVVITSVIVSVANVVAWLYFVPGADVQAAELLMAPMLSICAAGVPVCVWPAPLAVAACGMLTIAGALAYLIRSSTMLAAMPEPEPSPEPQTMALAAVLWAVRYYMDHNDQAELGRVLDTVKTGDDLTELITAMRDADTDPARPIEVPQWPTQRQP